MNKLDYDEQSIKQAISQISVNTAALEKRVRNSIRAGAETGSRPIVRRRLRWSAVLVAALSLMLISTVAMAAAIGKFDWFIEQFHPNYSQIVEPVEKSCENQGIRMEVIGAQKYGNQAIAYLSLQDVSGQNRLTERTEFLDGFSAKMSYSKDGTRALSTRRKMIFFDEASNTAYYEIIMTADADSPLTDPLTLGSFLIFFDRTTYEDEPVVLSLSDLKEADTVTVQKNRIWGWGSNSANIDSLPNQSVFLAPGKLADMPSGAMDQWISNIGLINGELHVQVARVFNQEFGSNDPSLSLKKSDGDLTANRYAVYFLADENGRFLDKSSSNASYKYSEFIFPLDDVILQDTTLYYNGSVSSGVQGQWWVTSELSNTENQMRILDNNISVDKHLFTYLNISPLGLQVIGSYESENCMASEMTLAFETTSGEVVLSGGGGSFNSKSKTFCLSWDTPAPVDTANITAVIINGTRIEMK